MSQIILHHYESSPYAKKVRTMLGYKKLAWRSVTAPMVMPKPDLVALTGGYRRVPVLQVGRDIYCDSRLIARVLDRLAPSHPLVPAELAASCAAFAHLESTLFTVGVGIGVMPEGVAALIQTLGQDTVNAFMVDRAEMFRDSTVPWPTPARALTYFEPLMSALDAQLTHVPFLLGAAPTLADFTAYHPIWFILENAGVRDRLAPFEHIARWAARIAALGEGEPTDLAAEAAVEIARASRENQPFDGAAIELRKTRIGQRVTVTPTDYGANPVEGVLVHASLYETVIQRTDDRAGEVFVHFPRADYKVVGL